MSNVARSLLMATSSSRFVEPNYWRDPVSGNAFQIQVEIPQAQMAAAEDVGALPLSVSGGTNAQVSDVATITTGTAPGLMERYNGQRVVSLTANIEGASLGQVTPGVRDAIARAGDPPRGVTVAIRGQIPPLEQTQDGLRLGLLVAVVAIFLLLAAYFQSARLAVDRAQHDSRRVCGVVIVLALTRTTLNVQSFMGAIMAMGIAVANAILLVAFAEERRRAGRPGRRRRAACGGRAPARDPDDGRGDDRRHAPHGARPRRGRRPIRAARPRRGRRPRRSRPWRR